MTIKLQGQNDIEKITELRDEIYRLRSIAVKMAAFCARLSGHDGVPKDVAAEGMKLAHEYKRIDSR